MQMGQHIHVLCFTHEVIFETAITTKSLLLVFGLEEQVLEDLVFCSLTHATFMQMLQR